MKLADLRAMTVDQLDDEVSSSRRSVQPALPAGDRQLENTARAAGASRHRADQDHRGAEARGPAGPREGDN